MKKIPAIKEVSFLKASFLQRATRFFALLVILYFMGIHNLLAQVGKYNFSFRNISLEKAIEEIEKNTDFVFFYNNSEINLNEKIDKQFKDTDLQTILDQVFKSYNYRIENKKIVLLPKVSEENTINGRVTSQSGEAIVGANIVRMGFSVGVITDGDGQFSIKAS